MNFVLGFDDGYSPFAAATITSVCTNNQGKHNFYVFTDYISESNKQKLEDGVCNFGSSITFISVGKDDISIFPIGKGTANTYVSIATYFRLFITSKLPSDVQRVIYLDCDIIVDGNLEEIWCWRFDDNAIILAADDAPQGVMSGCERLGIDSNYSYFNAGVFVIDVIKAKKIFNVETIRQYLNLNRDKVKFHDQDILNALLHDKRALMPVKYNVLDVYYLKGNKISNRYSSPGDYLLHPVVIHFSGKYKPWHIECHHPMKFKFRKYLSMTSYANYENKHIYGTVSELFIYKVEAFAKLLMELTGFRSKYIKIDK